MGTKIVKLQAENIMRLKAVEITPDGALVEITGPNGHGKTSVLDSIMMGISGPKAKTFPRKPVREGAEQGTIRIEFEKLVLTRIIHADGESKLALTTKDGAKYSSPQALLDGLAGAGISFDPLAFIRKSNKEQLELLRRILGLDTSELDAKRKKLYDERYLENREADRLKGEISSVPQAEAPAEEISMAALADELRQAEEHQQRMAAAERSVVAKRQELEKADAALVNLRKRLQDLHEEVAKVQAAIGRGEQEALPRLRSELEAMCGQADELRVGTPDTAAIRARIAESETVNAKVRSNKRRRELEQKRAAVLDKSKAMTKEIEALDEQKRALIASAPYPLPGLSVDDEGVLLNGVPLEQASMADKIRTSVAIGAALNPDLRVMTVYDGSLLNKESRRLLAEEAAKADIQLWLEVATEPGEGFGVVIEDGTVQSAVPSKAPAAP
jgi:DNA repair exonuclease SbcCD ATPase subunit